MGGKVCEEIWRCVHGKSIGEGILSKIDKRLLNMALHMIIMEFGGRTTLVEAFAVVEQCDRALCQHDATNLVSLLVEPQRASVTTT